MIVVFIVAVDFVFYLSIVSGISKLNGLFVAHFKGILIESQGGFALFKGHADSVLDVKDSLFVVSSDVFLLLFDFEVPRTISKMNIVGC
jgi:hypothetical protein